MTLQLVAVEHRLLGYGTPEQVERDLTDGYAPGYCECGRWGYVFADGPTDRTCPGLLAMLRGEQPPVLDRQLWQPIA